MGKLAVPENMRLIPLPAYSPGLNPVDNIWEEIREKGFDNKVFDSMYALEEQLVRSLKHLEDHPEIYSRAIIFAIFRLTSASNGLRGSVNLNAREYNQIHCRLVVDN